MDLEVRACKSPDCTRTWKCLKTSPNWYCCLGHNPDSATLAPKAFTAERYIKIRKWLVQTVGEAEDIWGDKDVDF
jgi:hypothetical protein